MSKVHCKAEKKVIIVNLRTCCNVMTLVNWRNRLYFSDLSKSEQATPSIPVMIRSPPTRAAVRFGLRTVLAEKHSTASPFSDIGLSQWSSTVFIN